MTEHEELKPEKISNERLNFLRLIDRSADTGDGWRKVSKMLERLVEMYGGAPFSESKREGETLFVRLTAEGQTLATYARAS